MFGGDTISNFEAEDSHTHAKHASVKVKARPTTKREVIVFEENTFNGQYQIRGLIGLFNTAIPLSDKRKDAHKNPVFRIYTFPYGDKDLELYLYRCWKFTDLQIEALEGLVSREGVRIVKSSFAQIDLTPNYKFEIHPTFTLT